MKKIIFLLSAALVIMSSCNRPKEVEATGTNTSEPKSTGVFDGSSDVRQNAPKETMPMGDDTHTVTVIQVLPTEKYVYLEVTEKADTFWVATSKRSADVGDEYFFKGGLLKTNFQSKEYDRVFDKVYLVSKLVPLKTETRTGAEMVSDKSSKPIVVGDRTPHPESISIADIVSDPETFKDKKVIVSGQCTKLNPNIMNRNWIHLKDGSKDDFDFVLTSDVAVPEGHYITMEGVIRLNKDFGAGYRYNIIMEEAELVK